MKNTKKGLKAPQPTPEDKFFQESVEKASKRFELYEQLANLRQDKKVEKESTCSGSYTVSKGARPLGYYALQKN